MNLIEKLEASIEFAATHGNASLIRQAIAQLRKGEALAKALKMRECQHETRGGNDYLECPKCGLYFDYRNMDIEDALKIHSAKALAAWEDRK